MDTVDCLVKVHYEGKANNEEEIALSTRFFQDEPVAALIEQDQDATKTNPPTAARKALFSQSLGLSGFIMSPLHP